MVGEVGSADEEDVDGDKWIWSVEDEGKISEEIPGLGDERRDVLTSTRRKGVVRLRWVKEIGGVVGFCCCRASMMLSMAEEID